MTITDSRVQKGKLTFTLVDAGTKAAGVPLDVSCQVTNFVFKGKANKGTAIQTLCGDSSGGGGSTDWTAEGVVVQDFDDPAGFCLWALANLGKKATIEFVPNDLKKVSFSQVTTIEALDIGGNVGAQVTSAFAWSLDGQPVPGTPAGG
jgi:hypothetical protein